MGLELDKGHREYGGSNDWCLLVMTDVDVVSDVGGGPLGRGIGRACLSSEWRFVGGWYQRGMSNGPMAYLFSSKRAASSCYRFGSLEPPLIYLSIYTHITGIGCLVPRCRFQRFLRGLRLVLPPAPSESACHIAPSISSFDPVECPQTHPALASPSGNSYLFPRRRPSDPSAIAKGLHCKWTAEAERADENGQHRAAANRSQCLATTKIESLHEPVHLSARFGQNQKDRPGPSDWLRILPPEVDLGAMQHSKMLVYKMTTRRGIQHGLKIGIRQG